MLTFPFLTLVSQRRSRLFPRKLRRTKAMPLRRLCPGGRTTDPPRWFFTIYKVSLGAFAFLATLIGDCFFGGAVSCLP